MKLKTFLLEALNELDDGTTPVDGNENLLEFPNMNFTIAVFRDQKKLLFSPQDHSSIPNKIRTFVNDLKQTFRISSVIQKDIGSFEVTLDPRTDLDSVLDYIKQEIEPSGNV